MKYEGCTNFMIPNEFTPTTIVSGSRASTDVTNSQSLPQPSLTRATRTGRPTRGANVRAASDAVASFLTVVTGQEGLEGATTRSTARCNSARVSSDTSSVSPGARGCSREELVQQVDVAIGECR